MGLLSCVACLFICLRGVDLLPTNREQPRRFEVPNLRDFGLIFEKETYDYVIVGAGTAGMTIAARLSEDPNVRVAVLEAGIDYELAPEKALIDTPGSDTVGCGSQPYDNRTDAFDWRFSTTPQSGANNRTVRYARGKIIGGSSARNFMIYQRPSKSSLDQWAELTGDHQWTFKKRLADYQKSVSFTAPKHDLRQELPAAQYDDRAFARANGPVQVSYPNTAQPFSKYMQLSLNEKGIPTLQDFNRGMLNGVQYATTTIDPKDSHRSSSRAFFAAARSRPNLVVYTTAMAKKIIFDHSKRPRAQGIEFDDTLEGSSHKLFAKKEVIISAGTFQSPQLLMVSGIGPRDQLTAYKIPTRVDNPNVGRGMQDHVFFGPSYPVYSIETLTRMAANPDYAASQFLNFTLRQQGPLTNNAADMISFEKFNASTLIQLNTHPLSGYPDDWPHVEYLSSAGVVGDFSDLPRLNLLAGKATGKEFVTILAALVAPQSRGTVELASDDASVPPLINPGWLTDPVDQRIAVEAFKRTREFFSAQAMQPILDGPEYIPGPSVNSDDEILNWIRNNLMTVWHAACTCSMRTKDQGGVLDSHFRVYGAKNLRVVDASAFPSLPPGHPQSTVYMIAERAASLIIKENSHRSLVAPAP
ncbi:hypothetical protein MJO29_005111 [Puccinia striiformis f. sp. tritici]|uniref:Glucose-methanol-choline oxidoreductase N-terminal domain-containing protein n=1 Tax=Puccinia striiformis f. sp. tritici PST-78 TaxID=1165861 RepID=A0A0L0VCJ9_9BASI|nr:hypothetical protein Pst134EB_010284 [Puccinia striiformis f. sp. tritici]KAI7960043.1 hypothetical protein MJO29_005111 [Puccinia striiformis f. sp. tritici]KNE96980.1 hypothetical protein PSTG_09716 [Puccinia striiformis f. sp. tritici PST-78]